jgi:hypothetical protein
MPPVPLLCRMGFHDWQVLYNDEGKRYNECLRCRKVKGKAVPSDGPDTDNRTGGTAFLL